MFIESVRARATCNTIISSHPISSHRPCTNSSLLSPRVSSPFPSWFFFYSSSTRSLSPPSLFTFTFLFTSSSLPLLIPTVRLFRTTIASRIRISDSSSYPYIPFIFSPPSLLFFFSFHPRSSSCFPHACIRISSIQAP